MRRRAVPVVLLLLLPACQAERPAGGKGVDAAPALPPLTTPTITDIPTATPLVTAAARGHTDGTRIVVDGAAGGAVVAVPLPSGDFCIDVPLASGVSNTLTFSALGDGQVSPSIEKIVIQDPAAAEPANAYCGSPPPECAAAEDCTEGTGDEDCDGWKNNCDLDCSGCSDDPYEPNDFPYDVPTFMPGTLDLKICPCHDDWWEFYLPEGTPVHVQATFNASAVDIDMKLFRAADAESGSGSAVDMSITTSSPETIDWTSNATGTYYLHVYAYQQGGSGAYHLTASY